MPKLKTHKGAKARFRYSGGGKALRMKGLSSHLRRKKPKKVTRKFAQKLAYDKADVKRLSRLIPYDA